MKTTIIAATVLALLSTASFADAPQRGERAQKHAAKTAAQYRRMAKNQVQHVERTRTMTRADGATATRSMTIDHDPDNKTFTKEINGERFNGKTYNTTDVMQRTDDGYTRTTTRTNGDGETRSRDVVAEFNREAGTMHKEITLTDKDGNTKTKAIDRERNVTRGE